MQPQSRTDERIAWIASRSHGVVTRAQLLRAGVTAEEIRQRIKKGLLIRVHRGVYRVGHRAPSVEAAYIAAVLACGEGALLMGAAAAHLYGLIKGRPPAPVVRTRTERRIAGIETHRARRTSERGTRWRGVPVTTVPTTLVDLAHAMPVDALARACHEARVRYRVTPDHVTGAPQRILSGHIPITLSALERRFLDVLREHGLPGPQTNRRVDRSYVDCRWPAHRVTVELDSYRFHDSRHAWEQDRRREREAHARGDDHRRYTYGDVFEDPRLMLAELRTLLA